MLGLVLMVSKALSAEGEAEMGRERFFQGHTELWAPSSSFLPKCAGEGIAYRNAYSKAGTQRNALLGMMPFAFLNAH